MDLTNKPVVLKTLLLLMALVSIPLLCQLLPSLGIIFVGLVVILIIEVTRLRYPRNTVEKALLVFSAMTIIWGWIGPHIQPLSRPLSALLILIWGAHCFSATPIQKYKIQQPSTLIILVIAVVVFFQDSYNLISPLLWGYDNSAHVPALSQVYRHGGFIYSGELPLDFTFSNYVNGYPPLQQSAWAFIMSIANVQMKGGYEILRYFSFFFFGTGLLAIALIANNWISINLFKGKWIVSRFSVLIVAVLVAFSQVSYVFWMGFPPFLWASCIVLALVRIVSDEQNQSFRLLLTIVGLTLVNYSYPLLSPVLILLILFEISRMSKVDFVFCWSKRHLGLAIILLIGVLNIAVVLKSLVVSQYLDDDGGIQPIELRNLMGILALVLLMFTINKYSFKSQPLIIIAFLGSILNFGILALLSQNDRGYVSYYPAKAGYLSFILGFACVGRMLNESPKFISSATVKLVQLTTTIFSFSVIWFSVSATFNSKIDQYGFYSTKRVWDELKYNQPNPGRDCFLNAMEITSDLNSNTDVRTILYLNDDLNTRWINGVRGRLTDATYSISIPIGQGEKALPEILGSWFIQYPNARLLILAPEPPLGLDKWGDRIEFRQFNCA